MHALSLDSITWPNFKLSKATLLLACVCATAMLNLHIRSTFCLTLLGYTFWNPIYRTKIISLMKEKWCIATFLFFIWLCLSDLWSPAPYHVSLTIDKRYLPLLYFPVFVAVLSQAHARFVVLHVFLTIVLISALVSICSFFHLIPGLTVSPEDVINNHITYGFFGAYMAYISACLTMQSKALYIRVMYTLISLILSFQILWINGGRLAYVLLVFLSVLWIKQFLSKKIMLLALSLLAVGLGCTYYFSPVMNHRVQTTLTQLKTYSLDKSDIHAPDAQDFATHEPRMQFHQITKQLFLAHPVIGSGTGSFRQAVVPTQLFPMMNWDVLADAHSQYWTTLAEQGLIGFALLLYFYFCLLRTARQKTHSYYLALGVIGAVCIGQFTETVLYDKPLNLFFELIMSVYLGEAYENN